MIEIPRDKLLNVGKQIQTLANSQTPEPNNWANLLKDFIENIPQGVAMVKNIIKDVKSLKETKQQYAPTKPKYDEAPKEKKSISLDNKARAKNIFNQLIEQGDKYKAILSTMKGNKLFDMMKKNKEIIVDKIEEELNK